MRFLFLTLSMAINLCIGRSVVWLCEKKVVKLNLTCTQSHAITTYTFYKAINDTDLNQIGDFVIKLHQACFWLRQVASSLIFTALF